MNKNLSDTRKAFPPKTIIYGKRVEPDILSGERQKYVIVELIGRGGSGLVYKAEKRSVHDDAFIKNVCLKEFFPNRDHYQRDEQTWTVKKSNDLDEEFADFKEHIIQEMQCGRHVVLNNKQTAAIEDVVSVDRIILDENKKEIDLEGTTANCYLSVMDDYTHAMDLKTLLVKLRSNYDEKVKEKRDLNIYAPLLNEKKDNFSPFAIFQIIRLVLDSLSKIHENNYIHGDIQPCNILFDNPRLGLDSYDLGTAVFIDFGSARKIDPDTGLTEVITDRIYTTPQYIAPEQLKEGSQMGRATDIFQVNKLLYALLSGEITKDNPSNNIEFPRSESSLNEYGLTGMDDCTTLFNIMEKANSQEMSMRYQSAEEFSEEIYKFEIKYFPREYNLAKDYYIEGDLIPRDDEIEEIEDRLNKGIRPLYIWSEVKGIGKTTFAYMLNHYFNSTGHNAYLITFTEDIFKTIANIETVGIYDSDILKEEDKYRINLELLSQLSEHDVVIIDNFYDENINLSELKGKTSRALSDTRSNNNHILSEYSELISRIKAKIIITTNYRPTVGDWYELKNFSEETLIRRLGRIVGINDDDTIKKGKKLISQIGGHTYLFTIICNLLRSSGNTLDDLLEVFDKNNYDENLEVPYVTKDRETYIYENLIDLMKKLYDLSNLSDLGVHIMEMACFSANSKANEKFLIDIIKNTSPNSLSTKNSVIERELNSLIMGGWLKRFINNGKKYITIHDLVNKVVRGCFSDAKKEDLVKDLMKATKNAYESALGEEVMGIVNDILSYKLLTDLSADERFMKEVFHDEYRDLNYFRMLWGFDIDGFHYVYCSNDPLWEGEKMPLYAFVKCKCGADIRDIKQQIPIEDEDEMNMLEDIAQFVGCEIGLENISEYPEYDDICPIIAEKVKKLYNKNFSALGLEWEMSVSDMYIIENLDHILECGGELNDIEFDELCYFMNEETDESKLRKHFDFLGYALPNAWFFGRIGFISYENGSYHLSEMAFRKAVSLCCDEDELIIYKTNLAYIIRRGEIQDLYSRSTKEIEELLSSGVEKKNIFSLINLALLNISDYSKENGWYKADNLISMINRDDVDEAYSWWQNIALKGDNEGYLVILLLLRHGLIENTNYNLHELFDIVKDSYPDIPLFM